MCKTAPVTLGLLEIAITSIFFLTIKAVLFVPEVSVVRTQWFCSILKQLNWAAFMQNILKHAAEFLVIATVKKTVLKTVYQGHSKEGCPNW